MHVLPLPFGLALAVVSRRNPDRIKPAKPERMIWREPSQRDRILGDIRYLGTRST